MITSSMYKIKLPLDNKLQKAQDKKLQKTTKLFAQTKRAFKKFQLTIIYNEINIVFCSADQNQHGKKHF